MRKGIIYVYFNRAKYEKEGIEKYYVGQTIGTMEQRAKKDGRGYCWANPNCNNKFANSIRKWGWDAFEGRVLEEVYEEDLDELEKFYIEQFDSYKNGYNATIGGEGNHGHNCSEETKNKLSIASKKTWKNPKTKEKISEAQRKSHKYPKGVKRNIRSSKLGEKHGNAKSVYCEELNIVFSYIKIAEKYCVNVLNSKASKIGDVCNGYRNSTGRYNGTKLTWKYKEDIDKETLNNAEYIDSEKYEEIIKAKLSENK